MTIKPLGFIDTSTFAAMFLLGKAQKERTENGVLRLRDIKDGEADASDLAILKEWKSARALLSRLRSAAAAYFDGVTPKLGRAWVEVLPPGVGTPWESEAGDYADNHVRTRTALVSNPGAVSYCGSAFAVLNIGWVNQVDHHQLCSELNIGDYPRVHLVVDVRIPDAAED